jgi:hypothetical protein
MLLVTAAFYRESLPWRGLGLVHDGNVTTVRGSFGAQGATGRAAHRQRTKRNRHAEEPDALCCLIFPQRKLGTI